MARKRALSNTAVKAEPPAEGTQTPAKGSNTPLKSARSTRGSAKVKAESPDAVTSKPIVKTEQDDEEESSLKDDGNTTPARRRTPKRTTRSNKKPKLEDNTDEEDSKGIIPDTPKSMPSTVNTPSKSTISKKLKQLEQYLQTPFPDYPYPTPEQCQNVQDSLSKVHGLPKRPSKLLDIEGGAAGCGAVPDVLDALVRTILSQNTTSASECIYEHEWHLF